MIYCLVDFAVPAGHRMKIKKGVNINIYVLARGQKRCGI